MARGKGGGRSELELEPHYSITSSSPNDASERKKTAATTHEEERVLAVDGVMCPAVSDARAAEKVPFPCLDNMITVRPFTSSGVSELAYDPKREPLFR